MNKCLIIYFIIFLCNYIVPQTTNNGEWETLFERSDYLSTPSYDETMDYFQRLDDASEFAEFVKVGTSPQGRDLNCLIVSKDQLFDPVTARNAGKPVILILNGIHSGEIEGKDACMLLLREILITKEKESLIDNVILLVIPIFSVDGHERKSMYNRINQNGPVEMGWRTTAQNLNLNRDWMKADAPEMQAMLSLYNQWLPDFLIDNHTTDGADYQYTITYGIEIFRNIDDELAKWNREKLIPYITEKVEDAGYLVSPYVYLKNWGAGLDSGIVSGTASPRFSQGYAAIQNRSGLLVETHMIKPYKDRVYSTKEMVQGVMELINSNPQEIIRLNKEADERSIKEFYEVGHYLPLTFRTGSNKTTFDFKGIKYIKQKSTISGDDKIVYTGENLDMQIPYYNEVVVTDSVKVPAAYLIPAEWGVLDNIIERIKLHGITVEVLAEPAEYIVTRYKFSKSEFSKESFESHHTVAVEYHELQDTITAPAGTLLIRTDQRAIKVLVNLLEPKSGDSFLRWGYFNSIFEQKEYFESYVMEKTAEEMLQNDPLLKEEFEKKLNEDEQFRNDPYERLNFFYKRSPYYDELLNMYPVMRIER